MKRMVPTLGALVSGAAILALAGCSSGGSGGTAGSGGTSGSGSASGNTTGSGSTGSGTTGSGTGSGSTGSGTTGSGTTGSGSTGSGTTGSGTTGSGSTGSGTTGSGTTGSGTTGSGSTGSGTTGSGSTGSGTTGSGSTGSGTTGSGTTGSGSTGSGATGSSGTMTGHDAGAAYKGPCDIVPGGCAEAYSLTRATSAAYTGPLFQLGRTSSKATMDVGQTPAHMADMTTWSAFCGGTQSNCVVSKIYAQVHPGNNDLTPGVWKTPWNPDCSAGGFTCAAPFTIETATGLPILTTVSPQEYALAGDVAATGINGHKNAMGIIYNGKPVPNATYCCGVFGLTHAYNASDTAGTDFMLVLAYGQTGNTVQIYCGSGSTYCVGAEEEENNDLADYGSSPVANALVVTQYDPTANSVTTFLNGTQKFSHSPPKANLNASTNIHLGGGGDLSQPDPVLMREAMITNAVLSASTVTALTTEAASFYALSFP